MDSVAGIRIFVRVVAAASFSQTAKQLGVAPSSASWQINQLEEELGARAADFSHPTGLRHPNQWVEGLDAPPVPGVR